MSKIAENLHLSSSRSARDNGAERGEPPAQPRGHVAMFHAAAERLRLALSSFKGLAVLVRVRSCLLLPGETLSLYAGEAEAASLVTRMNSVLNLYLVLNAIALSTSAFAKAIGSL
ncbi:uncharacterized protein K452DRAFT_125573 [Aplosporella prunicola CBS 121167]|uniref:Uncharacterized protein n=1 Tax=Aplosporella prunicola CBS 121167 TaxID=1176127 RepID=A0A6A6BT59_9PEZI|nr:uncharacterized protein K452DRAFT_125573 [Aplosporella prunicola CBS 121167]KAF2145791.1 hypothetical protein K452DRAFT_125573 [Aplosporella prunicola CBS 121167]